MTTTPKPTLTISPATSPERLSKKAISLGARQLAELDEDQVYALAHVALSIHILSGIQHKLDPKNPAFALHHKHTSKLMETASLPIDPVKIVVTK